jgi:hypothetical protein
VNLWRLLTIVAGLAVLVGLMPWAYNLLFGRWFSAGQQTKWETRFGHSLTPGLIRLMGLGGVLVMFGLMLAVLAIFGVQRAEVTVPVGLGLVAVGAITSLIARRRARVT